MNSIKTIGDAIFIDCFAFTDEKRSSSFAHVSAEEKAMLWAQLDEEEAARDEHERRAIQKRIKYAREEAWRASLRNELIMAGDWFVDKFIRQAAVSGVLQAAKNIRKQGAPIEVALAILVPGARVRT